jgi:phosphate starvation-inducible PhoH-like protein
LTDTRNDDLNAGSSPNGDGQQSGPRSQVKIVIPADHSMVSLLGSGDELLHVIEREFAADIHVRGNEITATGTPSNCCARARS